MRNVKYALAAGVALLALAGTAEAQTYVVRQPTRHVVVVPRARTVIVPYAFAGDPTITDSRSARSFTMQLSEQPSPGESENAGPAGQESTN